MSATDGDAEGGWAPPRRRGRRLVGPIALAAAVVVVAALAIWGGGGHTATATGRRLHGYPTTPPYPDFHAMPVAAKTKLATPGPVYLVIQGRVRFASFRVVAFLDNGRTCFASDDHSGAIAATTCWTQPTPTGAAIAGQGFGEGVGGITVGVAGPSVVAVSLVGTDGTSRFVPTLRMPGTDARVWAAVSPVPKQNWRVMTALDRNGTPVASP